jgi:molybdate transport system substrate-binding protein
MRTSAIAVAVVAASFGWGLLFARPVVGRATGQSTGVRVLASDGVKPAVEELVPKIKHSAGQRITMEFDSSKKLEAQIEAGGTFDVAILTTDSIDTLIKHGRIAAGTRTEIARSGIGVGIRAGAAKPDISTPDALKQTLLGAKSIAINPTGASAAHFDQVIARLGIAENVRPKFILEQEPARAQMDVADGKTEIVITLIPEILDVRGVELAGPLPADLQSYISFAAGVATNTGSREAAEALIKFVAAPTAAATFKGKGLEPRASGN